MKFYFIYYYSVKYGACTFTSVVVDEKKSSVRRHLPKLETNLTGPRLVINLTIVSTISYQKQDVHW